MSIILQSPQCFAIAMVIFGLIGFLQGGRRAIVLMAFTLAALFFLTVFNANGIAEIFFVRIPQTINVLTGGAIGPKSPTPPSSTEVLIAALIALGVAMGLGFIIGGAAFPPIGAGGGWSTTAHTAARFLGLICGLVTGYAFITYISRVFAANLTISLGVIAPSASSLSNYILILVIIAIVAIVLYLLVNRFGRT